MAITGAATGGARRVRPPVAPALTRLQHTDDAARDHVAGLGCVSGHVGGGDVRPRRLGALPLLDYNKGVGPELGLKASYRYCQINVCRAEGATGGIRDHAAATAILHWFGASARKIRSVERETRWRWRHFTTKSTDEGTGLGLSISYDIGGTIEVESRVGEFTEFTLRLPRAYRPAPAEAAS